MGGSKSKPAPPPPPEPLLSRPWRDIKWTELNLQEIRNNIKTVSMPEDVPKPKILLYGLVGAGKSSFINSVISISKGRIAAPVQAGSCAGTYTTKFRCISDQEEFGNYQLCDTMGLEMKSGKGILLDDVLTLIRGHISDGYEFNPERPIDERTGSYIQVPERKDKICCVAFVVSATTILSGLPEEAKFQIQEVQKVVKGRDISRVLIITKIDEVCDEVNGNIQNVYRSKILKEAVEIGAKLFFMPVSNVHLVKNYSSEHALKTSNSILLLGALLHAIRYAADYLEFR